MRIADKMQFDQVQGNLQKNRSEMSDLQNQAATQKRINKPSDDPLATARVLASRTEERGNEQFIKNITQAKGFLEFSDQTLSELSEALLRVKELAVAQSSDAGASASTRRIAGIEVEQIYNQAIQVGNRKLGERYIFGGFKTQNPPFNRDGEYSGDNGEMRVWTHKDTFTAMNIPGSKVFLGKGFGGTGLQHSVTEAPLNVEQVKELRREDSENEKKIQQQEFDGVQMRGPASLGSADNLSHEDPATGESGINVFKAIKALEIALKTNDKQGVQDSLDILDQAQNQIVLSRSEIGSRVSALNGTVDSLHKATVDNKTLASQLEDADTFKVVSDINRTESTLKATLETSGKLIQPRLLDFLK